MTGIAAMTLDPILPPGLILAIALTLAILTALIYARVGAQLPAWKKFALILLRVAGIILVTLILLVGGLGLFL